MLRHAWIATVGGALLAASGTALGSQDEIDLTGTYEATYTCEGVFDAEPFAESLTFEAQVEQDGRILRLQFDDEGGAKSIYEGVVDPVEPGEDFLQGVVQACGGDFDFEELMRIENAYTFELDEEGATASFNVLSIFVTENFPGAEGILDIETCAYSFNRISEARPSVGLCDFQARIGEVIDCERASGRAKC